MSSKESLSGRVLDQIRVDDQGLTSRRAALGLVVVGTVVYAAAVAVNIAEPGGLFHDSKPDEKSAEEGTAELRNYLQGERHQAAGQEVQSAAGRILEQHALSPIGHVVNGEYLEVTPDEGLVGHIDLDQAPDANGRAELMSVMSVERGQITSSVHLSSVNGVLGIRRVDALESGGTAEIELDPTNLQSFVEAQGPEGAAGSARGLTTTSLAAVNQLLDGLRLQNTGPLPD
jgi:hypothetical protein